MSLRTALFLIPALMFAQAPSQNTPKPVEPPAEVDQALRARVKEFFQYSVDGNFRKAYDMVAEESKDFYFGMAKLKTVNFEFNSIEYSDNFTKALVKGTARRNVMFVGHEVEMPMPSADTWKLENGKWMWAQPEAKVITTPMGQIAVDPAARSGAPATTSPLPKDMSPEAVAAAAKQLEVKAGVSKEFLTFTNGKAGSDEVVFHNGLNGFVHVLATPIFDGGVFKAEPAEADVGAFKDQKFVVRYDPTQGTPTHAPTLRLTIEPFEQVYYVPLTLLEPTK
jgi:hypothetical protein